jgi:hypothetical protein
MEPKINGTRFMFPVPVPKINIKIISDIICVYIMYHKLNGNHLRNYIQSLNKNILT